MTANWFIAGGCTSAAAYEFLVVGSPVWAVTLAACAIGFVGAKHLYDRDARF